MTSLPGLMGWQSEQISSQVLSMRVALSRQLRTAQSINRELQENPLITLLPGEEWQHGR